MKSSGKGLSAVILILVVFLYSCSESGTQSQPNLPSREDPALARKSEVTLASIRVVITPLRNPQFGTLYGAEARDERSGALLATAKQIAMEGEVLVVQETQYSKAGTVVYKGKLFFSGDELVREEKIQGDKIWDIFVTWISDDFGTFRQRRIQISPRS